MGSRGGEGHQLEALEHGYYFWNGVSGVPGLGVSLHNKQIPENTCKDWTASEAIHPSKPRYQGIPKVNLRYKSNYGSTCSSTSSLVLPRLSCHNCGQRGDAYTPRRTYSESSGDESVILAGPRHETFTQSSVMKTHPPPTRPNLKHSKSLNSLPEPHIFTPNIKPTHKKLERARGANLLKPRVTFSEFTENINVSEKHHPKLARQENILRVNLKYKSSPDSDNKCIDTSSNTANKPFEIRDNLATSDTDETESDDHYKTVKGVDDDYSYAYRDAFSPAVLIRLEEDETSEYSEDLYEVIEHPENTPKPSDNPKVPLTSDSQSDPENPFFLSISKGRRNQLKLHKFVDWDLESDFEESAKDRYESQVVGVQGEHPLTSVGEEDLFHTDGVGFHNKIEFNRRDDHRRVVPLILEETEENTAPDTNYIKNRCVKTDSEIKYFRYKNYRNVRSSKIKKMIRKDVSQVKSGKRKQEHLSLKKSLSRKMSSISFFAKDKEKRSNLKKSLQRKLSSMVISMMNIF